MHVLCMVEGFVNKSGDTPVELAVREGKLDVMKYFVLEHKVTVSGEPIPSCCSNFCM